MAYPVQMILENDKAIMYPLQETDFEALYSVASDPKVWEQHPNKDRWKKEVFQSFFEGAMQSGGAYKIVDKDTGKIAGSTRFYDANETDKSILIGYTFYGTAFWGTGMNPAVKRLMLDHIFQYVDKVIFHIGATNYRSQIAIQRLGAVKTGELEVAYHGEPVKLNFVYEIEKANYV